MNATFQHTDRSTETTMKAIVQDSYGSTDVLELRHIANPENAEDEVLVRVHAAGVDRGVWHLTFDQAGVVAISGLTALQAVRDHGTVQPGQEVLITVASGGVGAYAVQLAKAFGAQVTGTSSTTKVDFVRSIGADHVIDYTQEDFSRGEQRYDVILDIAGNPSLSSLRRALTPRGTAVIVGGDTGGRWLGGYDRQLRALVLSRFVGQTLAFFVSPEKHEDMLALAGLIEAGKVTPVIDRTYPLAEAADAIRYLKEGHARAKVVVTVHEGGPR